MELSHSDQNKVKEQCLSTEEPTTEEIFCVKEKHHDCCEKKKDIIPNNLKDTNYMSKYWYSNSLKEDAIQGVLTKLIISASICVLFISGLIIGGILSGS